MPVPILLSTIEECILTLARRLKNALRACHTPCRLYTDDLSTLDSNREREDSAPSRERVLVPLARLLVAAVSFGLSSLEGCHLLHVGAALTLHDDLGHYSCANAPKCAASRALMAERAGGGSRAQTHTRATEGNQPRDRALPSRASTLCLSPPNTHSIKHIPIFQSLTLNSLAKAPRRRRAAAHHASTVVLSRPRGLEQGDRSIATPADT